MWVKCNSHRARKELQRIVGDIGTGWGVAKSWPPRGEYYEVDDTHTEAVNRVKGLTILRNPPNGGQDLFHYVSWS